MADDVSRHGMWSSRLLFVLAAAGSAIGLGNIWKFGTVLSFNARAGFQVAGMTVLDMVDSLTYKIMLPSAAR